LTSSGSFQRKDEQGRHCLNPFRNQSGRCRISGNLAGQFFRVYRNEWVEFLRRIFVIANYLPFRKFCGEGYFQRAIGKDKEQGLHYLAL
jgi:hypothetical protein